MADYPITLPAPLLADYDISAADAYIRTQMETGIARQRRRFMARPFDVSVSFVFVGTQMATFNTFYETTLAGGTAWFSMELDFGNGPQTFTQVRFKEKLRFKKMADQTWQVSSKLEVIQ